MNTKFKEAEEIYKKSGNLNDLDFLAKEASSFEELKTVCKYIIDSGMYKTQKPEGWITRECVHKRQLTLLIRVTYSLREKAKTEEQLIELCELSIQDVFWRGNCWNNHDNGLHPLDLIALRNIAKSFKGFCILYLYDEPRRDEHLANVYASAFTKDEKKIAEELTLQLKSLALTQEQMKSLTDQRKNRIRTTIY